MLSGSDFQLSHDMSHMALHGPEILFPCVNYDVFIVFIQVSIRQDLKNTFCVWAPDFLGHYTWEYKFLIDIFPIRVDQDKSLCFSRVLCGGGINLIC